MNRILRRSFLICVLAALLVTLLTTTAAVTAEPTHIQVRLHPVGGSNVTGIVDLRQMRNTEGTHIIVVAFGLIPGGNYLSLYYDNHVS